MAATSHIRRGRREPSLPRRARAAQPQVSWRNPGPEGDRLGVFDFPTFTLGRLVGIIKRSLMPNYVGPFDISIPEWRVLAAVGSASAISFNEIRSTLVMDRSQVSRTLSGLLARGMVEQSVTMRDQRGRGHALHQTKVSLTANGRAIYGGVLALARRQQMVLLNALSLRERGALQQALIKMLAAAEQFEAKQSAMERASAGRSRGRPAKALSAPAKPGMRIRVPASTGLALK